MPSETKPMPICFSFPADKFFSEFSLIAPKVNFTKSSLTWNSKKPKIRKILFKKQEKIKFSEKRPKDGFGGPNLSTSSARGNNLSRREFRIGKNRFTRGKKGFGLLSGTMYSSVQNLASAKRRHALGSVKFGRKGLGATGGFTNLGRNSMKF